MSSRCTLSGLAKFLLSRPPTFCFRGASNFSFEFRQQRAISSPLSSSSPSASDVRRISITWYPGNVPAVTFAPIEIKRRLSAAPAPPLPPRTVFNSRSLFPISLRSSPPLSLATPPALSLAPAPSPSSPPPTRPRHCHASLHPPSTCLGRPSLRCRPALCDDVPPIVNPAHNSPTTAPTEGPS